jgi:hypothetical protein
MGRMRSNLSARARKPRNSKYFFRIRADISLSGWPAIALASFHFLAAELEYETP